MVDLPRPVVDEESAPFWDGVRAGVLRMQRCAGCGALRHPPRPMCARCRSTDSEWSPVSGLGTVFSFIVSHQAVHPALVGRVPFVTVLVELDEGPRMVSNLVDVEPAAVAIGMRVRLAPRRLDEEITLPLFERAT